MKTTIKHPEIKAFMNDNGKPICGECDFQYGEGCLCMFKKHDDTPSIICPVWKESNNPMND